MSTAAHTRAEARLSPTIAKAVASFRSETIPDSVLYAAKRQVLDTLACAWAGSDADGVAGIRHMLVERAGKAEASTWVFGDRLPASSAARINGLTSAALDYDSLHDEAVVHAAIVIIPAAFAVAERLGKSGREALAAIVLGNELAIRLCGAVRSRPGWWYTSTLGVFAAAATAAYLMRLDERETTNALGIALCYAAGTGQALIEKSLTKRLQSAIAAEAGIEAAMMAQAGISGPAQAFDGVAGFSSLYTTLDEAKILEGLFEQFLILETTYKKYPSCFFNHAAIESATALIAQNALSADNVTSVDVVVSPAANKFVGGDFEPGADPQVAGQFSLQYSIASLLLRKRLGLAEIEPAAVCDARIRPIAERVRVIVDDARSGFVPVDVVFRTSAGQTLSNVARAAPGTPTKPLSDADLHAKATECFGRGARPLSSTKSDELVQRIMEIDQFERITDLHVFAS